MNYCATFTVIADGQELEMMFQNRKRYELLRNGICLEVKSNATSNVVLESDLIFESKR